jgi:hypothetical protein
MIDFRYHIVSLIAVFLALALGLFLGSTTLQSQVIKNLHHQADSVTSRNKQLEATNGRLTTQAKQQEQFIASLGPYAVHNALASDSVVLVSAPGVSGDERSGFDAVLQQAGATVTADVQLQSAYLDPTQDAELGGLATQLKLPGHKLPTANGSTQASSELAAVLTARPGHPQVAKSHADATLSALADGKFISLAGDPPTHAANLAVLLLPAPSDSASARTAQTQAAILVALADQLRKTTTAMVVAGATAVPPLPNGALAAVQADPVLTKAVSTVDLRDDASDPHQVAGQLVVVLSLADLANGGPPGSYGIAASKPVPTPSSTP